MPRSYSSLVLVPAEVEEEDIEHFTLNDMLGAGHVFVLHRSLQTLTLVSSEKDAPYPRLVAQVAFTERELDLFRPLVAHFPTFTPYPVLLASFDRGFDSLSEKTVRRAQRRLEMARQEEGQWDTLLRPVRNVMSRTRLKIREVGLDVVSMLETGYMLMKNPRW